LVFPIAKTLLQYFNFV